MVSTISALARGPALPALPRVTRAVVDAEDILQPDPDRRLQVQLAGVERRPRLGVRAEGATLARSPVGVGQWSDR